MSGEWFKRGERVNTARKPEKIVLKKENLQASKTRFDAFSVDSSSNKKQMNNICQAKPVGHRCNAKRREGDKRVTSGFTAARATQGDPASGSLSPRTALETEANWDRAQNLSR